MAAVGNCGVRVDIPHRSYTTSGQIHTRVESYCDISPAYRNTVSGETFRSRWFGWESVRAKSGGPLDLKTVRITVDPNCTVGTRYKYRTNGRGYAVINGQARTAAAYNDTASEVTCG